MTNKQLILILNNLSLYEIGDFLDYFIEAKITKLNIILFLKLYAISSDKIKDIKIILKENKK